MYHTPLTWYEQENLGHKAHFEALPPALWFASLLVQRWIPKTMPVGPTGRYTFPQTHNSAFLISLTTEYADIKECAVTKECYMMQFSCC
jgi:hypothetical protein